jgi:hypothetical protein
MEGCEGDEMGQGGQEVGDVLASSTTTKGQAV